MKTTQISAPFTVETEDSSVRILVIGGSEEDAARTVADIEKKGLNAGSTLRYNDGRSKWRDSEPVFDATQGNTGSAAYVWHADGDRCLHERVEYTLVPGADKPERAVLRRFYRKLD